MEKGHKDVLEKAVDNNLPVLLIGETGTGKTSFVRDLAERKGIELFRLNLTGQTGVDEFLGKWLASPEKGTYWLDGLLIRAMKEGKWIVLDEINMALPEILSALHSLLDDDRKIVMKEFDGSVVKPHEDFRLFATMNPDDEYAGTKELNKAFLSRFPVVMRIGYSDKEELIVEQQGSVEESVAQSLVMVGHEIRSAKKKQLITYTCSTRDLIYCASLMSLSIPKALSFEMSILNKVPNEEREAVQKIIELVTGEKIKTSEGKTFKSIEEMLKDYSKLDKELQTMKSDTSDLRDALNLKGQEADQLQKETMLAKKLANELSVQLKKELESHAATKEKAKNLIKTFESLTEDIPEDEKKETMVKVESIVKE